MTKKELSQELAKKCDLSQAKAGEIINTIFSAKPGEGIIAIALDSGDKVTIPGFGTFSTRRRAARTGTNPSTGEKIQIPARNYAHFRPGKTLKERVEQ
jgi:DNA-binding protein HU-beta